MNTNIDDRFSRADLLNAEAAIRRNGIGKDVGPEERITRTLIQRRAVALGDFALDSSPSAYVTDDDSVLGRCWIPYSGGIAWFESVNGLAHQLGWVLGLIRLREIRQLALLSPAVRQDEGHSQSSFGFDHNRLLHTYDVYAIGMIIAHNLGVKGRDFMALRLGLLVHDMFTSACGDLMKFVDRKRYDEDEMLSRLLEDERWTHLCSEVGIDPREPIRIDQEKDGILCSIRDLADTVAYVSRDLHMLYGYHAKDYSFYEEESDRLLEQELVFIADNPNAFCVWESVRRGKNDTIVIDNHEALHKFLLARALLFKLLYYHRQTRHVEYMLAVRLIKIMMDRGHISPEDFFGERGIDNIIWDKVEEETGFRDGLFHHSANGETHFFRTLEEAQCHVRLSTMGNARLCGLIYAWPSATKSKTGNWNVSVGGKEMPWSEAYPDKARRVEDIMRMEKGYHVAILNRESYGPRKIKPGYWSALRDQGETVV